MRHLLCTLLVLFTLTTRLLAVEINVLSWNVESGGADPEVIADQLAQFDGYELVGLSEVQPSDADAFSSACTVGEEANFEYLLGTTGGSDRLLLVWNSDRFEALEEQEFLPMRAQTGRAPLAVKLRERDTSNTFWFMVNHLHRTNANKRNRQARQLREWFEDQSIPVVAVGDYNLDYNVQTGSGNTAFNIIREGNHVRWVEPQQKTRTQKSFNSILDFVFVNDDAANWQLSSKILILEGEFQPDDEKSDHRPVQATIDIPSPKPPAPRAAIASDTTPPRRLPAGAVETRTPERKRVDDRGLAKASSPSDAIAAKQPERSGTRGPSGTRDELLLEQLRLMRNQIDLLERLIKEDR